jgi:hypothetical protein
VAITKIKLTGEGKVEIRSPRPQGQSEDDMLLTSSDTPLDEFTDALNALAPDVARMVGIPDAFVAEYARTIRVTGATWSWSENQGNGVMIMAQKTLQNVNSPLILNTPLHFYGDGDDENVVCNLPVETPDRLETLRAAASRFVNGERKQGQLNLGDEAGKGVRKAVKKMQDTAKSGGYGLSISVGGYETVINEDPRAIKLRDFFSLRGTTYPTNVAEVAEHLRCSLDSAHDVIRHELMRGKIPPEFITGEIEAPDTKPLPAAEMVEYMRNRLGWKGFSDGSDGATYEKALALVQAEGKCSTSFIQRSLKCGFNHAADLVDKLEAAGIISSPNHVGKREVLREARS